MKASDFFCQALDDHERLYTDPVWISLQMLSDYMKNLTYTGSLMLPGVTMINPDEISIGKGCLIEPGCLIEGPCIIGDGAIIRHGAAVRGLTILGKECVIGHSTEIKRSILFDRAKAPHFNYVGDSILGRNVNLGAGAKLANLRLDGQPIKVRENGEVYETGMRKFGGVLGDGCQVGCNCVINPGTLLPPNSIILPRNAARGVLHERNKTIL